MPTPFVTVLLGGGLLLLSLARVSWTHRAARSAKELTILLLASAIWTLAAGFEHLAPTLEGKILAARVSYFGVLALPVATLATTLAYGNVSRAVRSRANWLYLPSAVGVGMVLTNDLHGLHWRSTRLVEISNYRLLEIEHGPSFFLVSGLSQIEVVAAFLVYVWTRGRRWSGRQLLIYLGFLAPWVANLAYLFDLGPLRPLDLTPLGLVVMGLCFFISLFGLGNLLSVSMLAHRDVVHHIPDPVLVFDSRGRLVSANDAARRALDVRWVPLEAERQSRQLRELGLLEMPSLHDACPIVLPLDGEERRFEARSFPIPLRWQPEEGRVVVLRDVTEEQLAAEQVRIRRLQLRQIIDLIPYPIFARDAGGEYLLVNEACAKVYGSEVDEVEGANLASLYEDDDQVETMLAEDLHVIATGRPIVAERQLFVGSELRHFRTTKIAFPNADARETAIAGLAIDVTDEKAQVEELDRLASTDPLTGLANRRRFGEVLAGVVATARRRRRSMALLYIDLDHFKKINDVHGHPVGDQVLVEVARRIEGCIRDSDPLVRLREDDLTSTDAVSRLGGDEFVLVLPEIEQPRDAAIVARRLLRRLGEPLEIGAESIRLRASVGISIYPEDARGATELLRRCDQALSTAKRSGKNRVEFFSAAIGAEEERRNAVELALRKAIEQRELFLVYQPIWNCATGGLVGGEALLRWESDVLGTVAPAEFIAVAEQCGLVEELGSHVLRTLCEQLVAWRDLGLDVPRLSVNLSPVQVLDPRTSPSIEKILEQTGARASWLEFEITEGSILSRDPVAESNLGKLREMGATLALDDFGTGYSSLSHLRSFPFEKIKIDRSFVGGIGSAPEDEELTRAILALAQRLGLETVGEGVETEEQLEFLRGEGCEYAQGFLLARPVPAERFEELLRAEAPPSSEHAAGG